MRFPQYTNSRLGSQNNTVYRNNVNHMSPQILRCVYDDGDNDDNDNDNNNNILLNTTLKLID